jgi:subtilisin-like proprotein convertase family protein/Ca2+-binding EF-hand superfamily protein
LGRYDRNDDGFIDRNEAARARWTHRNPFAADLNKDDRLSRLELTQRYARRRQLSNDSDELRQKAWRTGSGIRTSGRDEDERREESQWGRRGGSRYWLTASVLGRFDRNRNGRLEGDEAQGLGIPVSRIDADLDGELSREELYSFLSALQDEAGEQLKGLPSWFYELDADRDGQVAMSEFATEWTAEKLEEFAALDTNDDGFLAVSEVVQSKAMMGGSYSNDTAQVLPPKNTVISEIEVSDDFVIADLNVQLSITHTNVSSLDAYLTGPDGQRIELFTEVGGSGDHFEETIFDDQARAPITKSKSPFKGSYLPEALLKRQPSLSHFNGKNIKGVWQLVIRGTRNERFGMLHSWTLIAKPQDNMLDNAPAADDAEK